MYLHTNVQSTVSGAQPKGQSSLKRPKRTDHDTDRPLPSLEVPEWIGKILLHRWLTMTYGLCLCARTRRFCGILPALSLFFLKSAVTSQTTNKSYPHCWFNMLNWSLISAVLRNLLKLRSDTDCCARHVGAVCAVFKSRFSVSSTVRRYIIVFLQVKNMNRSNNTNASEIQFQTHLGGLSGVRILILCYSKLFGSVFQNESQCHNGWSFPHWQQSKNRLLWWYYLDG